MTFTSKVTPTFPLTTVDVHFTWYLQSSSSPSALNIGASTLLVMPPSSGPPSSEAASDPPPSPAGAGAALPSSIMHMPTGALSSPPLFVQCMSTGPATAATREVGPGEALLLQQATAAPAR